MEAYILVVLLASVVSGRYADPVSHTVAVQKVGLVPSMREVLVSGHMGPAYVVPLPGYVYAAQQAPSIAHHVPAHQPFIAHTPIFAPAQHHQPSDHHAVVQHHQPSDHHAVVQHHQPSDHHAVVQHHQPMDYLAVVQHHQPMDHHAVVQHHQPLNHHTPLDQPQSVNHYGHDSQIPSPVRAHYGGNLHFKDSHLDAKSVEYELLEDVVSPVEKSTKTHKTSYHVSSKPVEHKRYEDSAYTFTSSHNHEDNDDYVQEEMHDTPAIHHNSMMQQFPSHHSPVIAHVSASNRGQIMQGHNVPVSTALHSFSSPQQHNENVQRGSVRYLGGEERLKSRSNGYTF